MKHRIRFRTTTNNQERIRAHLALSATGSAGYPIPEFPPMCVCCGAIDDLKEIRSPVMSGHDSIAPDCRVYACPQCKGHAVLSRFAAIGFWVVVTAAAFGVLLALYSYWVWAIGLWVLAIVILLSAFRHAYMNPGTLFGPGHGGPIRLADLPGSFEVTTCNDKLAKALRDLNQDLL